MQLVPGSHVLLLLLRNHFFRWADRGGGRVCLAWRLERAWGAAENCQKALFKKTSRKRFTGSEHLPITPPPVTKTWPAPSG